MKFNNLKNYILCAIILTGSFTSQKLLATLPVFDAIATNEIDLINIPSASGIIKFQDSYFIIGDDSPYLFQLDSEFHVINSIKIFSDKELQDNRLPKDIKPDFECVTEAPWGNDSDILVFGSGGTKEREVMIRIDIDGDEISVESYSLKDFYKHLSKKTTDNKKLNIEGAGYWNKDLILLNRSDNTVFQIDFEDFKKYLKDNDKDFPKVKSYKFNLPSINGVSARFSGLSEIKGEDIIVFTASVENDPNWIINENIVCSYLGILDMNQTENNEPICKLIKSSDDPIREKVESVFVTAKTDNLIKLIGVIDNDDGSSKLIEMEFRKIK